MRCPKKDKLTLFYYRELAEVETKFIKKHLEGCSRCQKEFQDISLTLSQLSREPLQLQAEEIEDILHKAKARIQKRNLLLEAQERLGDFRRNLRLGLSYRPQLVPILTLVLAVLLVIPFIGRRQRFLQHEFDILQIELELSLENTEGSMFELYEMSESLFDETSKVYHQLKV